MAEKKRSTAGKSKSGKSGSTRNSSTKKKTSGKKRRSKKQQQEDLIQSLVLFGIGVVLILMLFVPGKSVWAMLRNALFGVLGVGMYLLGAAVVYLAVCLAQGKSLAWETGKIAFGMIMLSGVTAVFSSLDTESLKGFWPVVMAYYKHGATQLLGSGVAGLPVGGLLLYLCGRPSWWCWQCAP